MDGQGNEEEGAPLATNRTMEIVVALILIGAAAVFIFDASRLGANWIDGQGPGAGYFPFYLGLILMIASLANLVHAVVGRTDDLGGVFTTTTAALRVLSVLGPALAYVALIGGVSVGPVVVPGLGIYVASAIFITFFVLAFGGEGVLVAIAVGLLVPLFFFFIFERWFLVPLPKGPLEVWLGFA